MSSSSTGRRWAYATWWGVLAVCASVIAWNSYEMARYDDDVAKATMTLRGRVTAAIVQPREDIIRVVSVDRWGPRGEWEFRVHDAREFKVDDPFWVRWGPTAPDRVYPLDARAITTDNLVAGITFIVLGLLAVQVPWLVRFVAWWRAARSPARIYQATLLLSYGRGRRVATPWLRLTGDGDRYQRVMWEPWLSGVGEFKNIEVYGRRAGRKGPIVVDVPEFDRLWPASRARRRAPSRFEQLEEGSYDPAVRLARWPTLTGLFLLMAVIIAVKLGVTAGVVGGAFMVSLILFFGGPPIGRVPRRSSS